MNKGFAMKESVYIAAQFMLDNKEMPTIRAIREQLGYGSFTTINKYLTLWKKETLLQPKQNSNKVKSQQLEDLLTKQLKQNQNMSADLYVIEQQNIEYMQKLAKLETDNELLLVSKLSQDKLLHELSNNNDFWKTTILQEKNSEIEKLKEEIKIINLQFWNQSIESNSEYHDAVMNLKVEIINLKDNVKRLTEQNSQLQKKIYEMTVNNAKNKFSNA